MFWKTMATSGPVWATAVMRRSRVWSRFGSRLGLGDFVEQLREDAVLKESEFRTCGDIVAAPL
ncbi:hypothetical protein SAMN05446934_9408 [Paraburkholderia hospita]|nr:hypothetical protein PMI06_008884 [Burkholderia sp. BT03]SKC53893.1 hypothetical protein SAMN06266956_0632 [Paraburkholderia hospita]SKD04714.1 hypothetical protein SAMN05446934_9408 [Paraburkholderia hospita]